MFRRILLCAATVVALANCAALTTADDWAPAKGRLMTRWAKEVRPDNALPEYPRPQLVRKEWTNLNGLWDYAIRSHTDDKPETYDGKILVPYPIESALSGVMKSVGEDTLWYRRMFKTPKMQKEGRLLLHFGAVDWDCNVFVNGKHVGAHRGGYAPFTLDITDALKKEGEQELAVSVADPTDGGQQPRGKQVRRPGGIFYTSVTGIWQTVWLEPVPKAYIKSIKIDMDFDKKEVKITAEVGGNIPKDWTLFANLDRVEPNGKEILQGPHFPEVTTNQHEATLELNKGLVDEPWSPDSPTLQYVKILLEGKDEAKLDTVETYFGLRKIEIKKDEAGVNRMFLNNKPLFQYGPLDQGWWPDGLYTAPTDAALASDIEVTKKLGMNMCRKHVKVEPARWYYHADRLGLLVWQDMVSGDRSIGPGDPDFKRSPASEETYRREWTEILTALHNTPSIVTWVPFNEGWGQFKTNEILDWTKKLDPSRIVDGPSGWADRGGGDMHDMHNYPGPGMFPVEEKRASVLGEFGGLGLPLEGHLWQNNRNWGYRSFKTKEDLETTYESLIHKLRPLVGKGLAAAVYTQTTDVEGEVNGLMTYDREVIKLDAEKVAALHKKLYEKQPSYKISVIAETGQEKGQAWRYTMEKPAEGWSAADFDDTKWRQGESGFGTQQTPGSKVRTLWDGKDIWLRRAVELGDADPKRIQLRIHHDEDAEIYVNGMLVAKLEGYTSAYEDVALNENAAAAFRKGKNSIAVHCRQTRGGQYIDLGLVEYIPVEPVK
jgi:hypothetical protein